MINKKHIYIIAFFILAGFFFSGVLLLETGLESGVLSFKINFLKKYSFVDIALSKSNEINYNSSIIGSLLFVFSVFLMLLLLKNKTFKLLNFTFLIFLFLYIAFDFYCIYLVSIGKYTGQHFRIPILIFLFIIFLLKKNYK